MEKIKVKDKSFRELADQYIYLDSSSLARRMQLLLADADDATGVLCYAYIDHERGIMFEALCCAQFTQSEHKLKLCKGNEVQSIKLPYASVSETEMLLLSHNLPRLAEFKAKIDSITINFTADANILKTRQITAIDHLRSLERPDEVLVHVVQGERAEQCYVRLNGVNEMYLYGTLASEPASNIGVHAGDSLSFYLVKNMQGVMCMAIVGEK